MKRLAILFVILFFAPLCACAEESESIYPIRVNGL